MSEILTQKSMAEKAKEALTDLAKYLRDYKDLPEEADTLIFISEHVETIGDKVDDFKTFFVENNIDFSIEIVHKYNIRIKLLVESGYFRFLFDSGSEWLGHEVKVVNNLPPIPPV